MGVILCFTGRILADKNRVAIFRLWNVVNRPQDGCTRAADMRPMLIAISPIIGSPIRPLWEYRQAI